MAADYRTALHSFNALMAEWAIHNPRPIRRDYLTPGEFSAARIQWFKGQMAARKLAVQASGIREAEKAVMAAYHANF